MPDRLDRAVVGGPVETPRRNRRPSRAGGATRSRRSPGAQCGQARAAVLAAVRQHAPRSGVRSRVPAGHPRERRPVHARRDLARLGARRPRRRRTRRAHLPAAQSDPPCSHQPGRGALPGGALRACVETAVAGSDLAGNHEVRVQPGSTRSREASRVRAPRAARPRCGRSTGRVRVRGCGSPWR